MNVLCRGSGTGASLGSVPLGGKQLHHGEKRLHLYWVCHIALTAGTPLSTHPGEYKSSHALCPLAVLGIVRFHQIFADLIHVSDISSLSPVGLREGIFL